MAELRRLRPHSKFIINRRRNRRRLEIGDDRLPFTLPFPKFSPFCFPLPYHRHTRRHTLDSHSSHSRWGTVGENLAFVVDVSGRRAPCCFGSALGPFGLAAAYQVPSGPRWELGAGVPALAACRSCLEVSMLVLGKNGSYVLVLLELLIFAATTVRLCSSVGIPI